MADENKNHEPPGTADRLRKEIDSGKAGDKTPFQDPATAPLGTDAEASGNPPTREEVERARAAEIAAHSDDTGRHRPGGTISDLQGRGAKDTKTKRSAISIGVVVVALLLLLWLFA
ncbi:hypothetical protein [Tranquillimonas alkanivorans]|uniref:Uncharacterized protein n=1 Tax=Tranquillimonas alkanivorans TaxID=441119 RepID=A0A1I5TZA0_9RHOB|nr:hypothetical protein [Tranquillimonas alkanivorans]SFP88364.1 hypothetical protein SAMN04488047_11631 [Tranquillimonas alkanivorans]